MGCWTIEQLVWLAAGAGFPDPAMAAAIAMAESQCLSSDTSLCPGQCGQGFADDGAIGDTGPNVQGPSKGLWQIDVAFHPDLDSGGNLLDPNYNAQAAYQVWLKAPNGGQNFGPWSTFNNGNYKAFYDPSLNSSTGNPPPGFPWGSVAIGVAIVAGSGLLAWYLTNPKAFRRLVPA